MKKLAILLVAFLAATSAFAQDNGDSFFFNHVAVGVSGGTDGVAIDAALPVGRHLALRGGYAFDIPYQYSYTTHVKMTNPWTIDDDITAVASMTTSNLHLLLDLFPGKKGGFHFTVGAYMMNKPGILHVETASPLPIPVSNYASTGVEFGGNKYLTTDPKGYVQADVQVGSSPIKPYVGIGFGRAVSESRVTFFMDLGGIYGGSINPVVYDYGLKGEPNAPISNIVTSSDVENNDNGWIDKIAGIPVWPVIKFNLFVRLF